MSTASSAVNAADHVRRADSGKAARSAADRRDLPVTHISADRGWFEWRVRQLWRYRDLILLFVWRDFVSVYKQTVLGPSWHVLRPILATITLTLVFGLVAQLPTDGAPRFLFYMVGQVAWTFFANSIDNISRTFVSNTHLLGKVYFHRLVVPMSVILSNLIAFGIQFGVFLLILLGYVATGSTVHVTSWVAALPVALVLLGGYALAAGLVVCALTTRYRDLSYVVTFGTQLRMYATPVLYPLSAVPEGYRWFFQLNPLTPVFEALRSGLLGVGSVTAPELAGSAIVMVAALTAGLMLFTRVEQTFLDTI